MLFRLPLSANCSILIRSAVRSSIYDHQERSE
jgi:hypothetical protein